MCVTFAFDVLAAAVVIVLLFVVLICCLRDFCCRWSLVICWCICRFRRQPLPLCGSQPLIVRHLERTNEGLCPSWIDPQHPLLCLEQSATSFFHELQPEMDTHDRREPSPACQGGASWCSTSICVSALARRFTHPLESHVKPTPCARIGGSWLPPGQPPGLRGVRRLAEGHSSAGRTEFCREPRVLKGNPVRLNPFTLHAASPGTLKSQSHTLLIPTFCRKARRRGFGQPKLIFLQRM